MLLFQPHINHILSFVAIEEISLGSFLSLTCSVYKMDSQRFLIVVKIKAVFLHFLPPFFPCLSHFATSSNLGRQDWQTSLQL